MASDTPAPAAPAVAPVAEAAPAAPAITPATAGSPLGTPPVEPAAAPAPAAEGAPTDPPAEPVAEATPVEYKFELPEGLELPDETLTQFKELATNAKLTQETASALMKQHTDGVLNTVKQIAEAQETAWNTTIEGWKKEFESDVEFGGAKKAETLTAIGKALDEFGSPEARQAFDVTGAGWNPHIVRFVAKMAKALSEGGPVQAGGPTSAQGTTIGQRLYGS